MGKHRSVDVRIAEVQAHLASLQAKAAKEVVSQDPRVQSIDADIKRLRTANLKWNRWATEGEDQAENFRSRADEWDARVQEAKAELDSSNAQLKALQEQRKALVMEVAAEATA